MSKEACPPLVTEKLTGALPAATVSTSGAVGGTVARVGCCGRQAITPGADGTSAVHVHPPENATHARTIAVRASPRKAQPKGVVFE